MKLKYQMCVPNFDTTLTPEISPVKVESITLVDIVLATENKIYKTELAYKSMDFKIQKKWRDVLQRVIAVHEELSELENSTARITSLQSFSKGTFSEIVSEIQKYKHIESILASLKQDIAIGASSALKTQEIKRSILDIRDLFLEVSNTFQDLDKIISMATQEDLSSIELNDSVKNINRANNIYSSISIDEINKSNVQINESLINIIEFLNLKAERLEKERLKIERLEKERLKIERLEKERLERERLEKERLERERLEKERLERERLEKERLEKEHIEKERLEKERLEKERLENESFEKELLEKERLEKERENDFFTLLLFFSVVIILFLLFSNYNN